MTITVAETGALPPTLGAEQTAEVWGVSKYTVLQKLRDGTPLPVEPLRFGRAYRWPTVAVLASVGIVLDPENDGSQAPKPGIPHTHPTASPKDVRSHATPT